MSTRVIILPTTSRNSRRVGGQSLSGKHQRLSMELARRKTLIHAQLGRRSSLTLNAPIDLIRANRPPTAPLRILTPDFVFVAGANSFRIVVDIMASIVSSGILFSRVPTLDAYSHNLADLSRATFGIHNGAFELHNNDKMDCFFSFL